MVPTRLGDPQLTYKPVAIDGLQIGGEPELITLRAIERLVKAEQSYKLIRCYAVLKDGNDNEYTLEIPYFIYCGLGQTELVVCKKYTLVDVNRKYYCLEIESLDKPELFTKDVVETPLAADNKCLQNDYFNLYKVEGPISRILNNYKGNIVSAHITTPRVEDIIHKAPIALSDLMSGKPLKAEYRFLKIKGEKYKVDLGGTCL